MKMPRPTKLGKWDAWPSSPSTMYVPSTHSQLYIATDPISFQMSATSDAPYARLVRPVHVPRDPALLPDALEEPRVNMGKLLKRVVDERQSQETPPLDAKQVPDTPRSRPIPLEEMERGERRFRALNPNGCIDYVMDVGYASSVRMPMLTAVFAIH